MKNIFSIVFIVLVSGILGSDTDVAKFQRKDEFDNLVCYEEDVMFSSEVGSKFQCTTLCKNLIKCYIVFYNVNTGNCSGCNTVYLQPIVLPEGVGNIHYQIYPVCENGWTGYMRSCYKLSSVAWFAVGAAECVSAGGHAVYIESSAENEFLKEYVQTDNSTFAWYIGITECAEQGVWRYFGTEELAQFTDFKELVTKDSCCALFFDLYDYQWAQFECEHTQFGFPTICERVVI